MDYVKLKSILFFLLKILLSLTSIWFVTSKLDIDQIVNIFRQANWALLVPAFLLFITSKIVSAFRLNIFFRNIDLSLSSKANLKLYLLGMFYNLFLPGGIGGDGYKVWILSRKGAFKIRYLASAVLLDRINGMVAIVLIVLGLVPFILIFDWYRFLILLLIPVGYLFYRQVVFFFFPRFRNSVHNTTMLSVLVQVLQVVSVLFISLATGVTDKFIYLVLIFLVSSVVAVLPLSIGGVGIRELVFFYGSTLFFIDISQAVAVSILFFVITAVTSFAGLYFVMVHPLKELTPAV